MSKRAIVPKLKALTADAKRLMSQLGKMSISIESKLRAALDRAWRLGQVFLEIKTAVGHGNWAMWLEANLDLSDRTARRYMELAAANPDAEKVEELSVESVRKFRLGYIPEKERPTIEGDESIPQVFHHLTIVNDFKRFERRVAIGQATLDKVEARKDLAPLFKWLCELYEVPVAVPQA